ncbi:methylenetetrahydrofolate--tRNA-(uracil(54)-C(5))-methyltransferase (FADH(2)-oxidizing) TrmFO [Desulfuromonas sp. AOP6]|uniref:methylenetetrahydrofolate--tRNA-(uracil(54)- C(5))-methyltransferase (FADH(2)-oxidizing) TrmFO n=1 Tax=Desulfuromonas sp. AOP6 TaxID=1566351 RepID=UPI0012885825|nr:methylenetetrahydrofolate--tRNA-(uracil(54)-C(5))-methyltransferase (FADH(2)-oxidizing) TrmFO [Desulfuromonas sp. AOP6]BCA78694.1 methylenetetrahydrofolate--tRNA-(uracil-5-)-methyltransferase TrmFO [Desulfuromonas sp. AOP6]
MDDMNRLHIIGAGLAGCEAAWQAAQQGTPVILHEMKPQRFSPAHQSPNLAELVCSNSLRGTGMNNAVGCLKEELRRCGTLFMAAADATAVPAGGALAVDREAFSATITDRITAHPLIELRREEITRLPETGTVIVASGPLTSEALSQDIARRTGADHLYFYDAIAPIIEADSIDFSQAWRASRYGKGGDDYVNCPLDETQYRAFVAALKEADKVAARDFEKMIHFEGCMPIEEMAERGEMTLAFGPMKPVGLPDPRTGREPFAVIQLRQDDRHASLYNIVGFQTKLTYPEQRRIFRTIPGLEQARFARLGSVHRNTFINAPTCLTRTLQLRQEPRIFFAGQITGVEGYVESAAMGFLAGLFAPRWTQGAPLPLPPPTTGLGALLSHLADSNPEDFQPMNVNYGLFPPLEGRKMKRADRRLAMADRALRDLDGWWTSTLPTGRENSSAPKAEHGDKPHLSGI